MTPLSPLVSRALALTLLLALAAGLWSLAVEPALDRLDGYRQSIAQSQQLLLRYQRIAQSRAEMERARKDLLEQRSATRQVLQSESAELAAAEIQDQVKGMIESSGGSLKSLQSLPATDQNDLRRIAVRVNMLADTPALQGTFYAIETATPYLFVENVDIRARRRRARRQQQFQADELQVRFDLYGFMRRDAS